MNILLTNVHSARNAGDAILLKQSLALLYAQYPNANITLVLNDPASYDGTETTLPAFATFFKRYDAQSDGWKLLRLLLLPIWIEWMTVCIVVGRLFGVALPLPSEQRRHLQAYLSADLVASVGGNYFYSSGKIGLPFLFIWGQLALAILLKKPLALLPQTLGPLRGKRDPALVRWLTNRATIVFLRDAASKKYVGTKRDHTHVVPDLAFAGLSADADKATVILNRHNVTDERPLIGITTLNWGALNARFTRQSQYETTIAELARHIITQHNATVLLLSQVQGPTPDEDDRRTANRVYAKLQDLAGQVVFVEEGCSAETLQAIYEKLDLLVGTRLHSNIFALTAHTPVLAIAYQPKTLGVLKMLHLEEWVLPIETITGVELVETFERLWSQKETVQIQIEAEMANIERELARTGMLLKQSVPHS